MISILDVLNNFINTRFNVKSRDRSFLLDSEQTSSPYSRMGIHFWHISCKITSSDASRPSLANIPSLPIELFTQRRSVAKSVGCFHRRLFVCVYVFVCLSTR